MIASNYRKHPDAMALQLVLPFGRVLKWATSRPTTRILRAIRADRSTAFKTAGRIAYPQPKPTPQWWKNARAAAKGLEKVVKAALMPLIE